MHLDQVSPLIRAHFTGQRLSRFVSQMHGVAAVAVRHASIERWNGSFLFESQFESQFVTDFDPIELWGTHIPFVDPFSFDERTFRTDTPAPPPSMNGALFSSLCLGLSLLTSQASPSHPRFQDSDDPYRFQDPYHHQEPLLPQRIVQLAAITIDTLPELAEVVAERVRLSPDQAIYIFQQRSTKTSRTAALLSAKFGVTSKAIRDIWTGRSWADETRPFWTGPQ